MGDAWRWYLLCVAAEIDEGNAENQGIDMRKERKLLRDGKLLRDVTNPFEMKENDFIGMYRLSRDLVRQLCADLQGRLERMKRNGIPTEIKVSVGENMKIVDIFFTRPGSFHDARIFEGSGLKVCFEQRHIKGRMLGDCGYPCLPYLFTPLLHPHTEADDSYNQAHIRTRNVVERTFGVWKRRFRCLTKKMEYKPPSIVAIICATAVLYNISRDVNAPLPQDEYTWVNVIDPPAVPNAGNEWQ